MPICSMCGRDVCKPCVFQPANDNKRAVTVASNNELLRRSHFQRLAVATRALGLPRREIPNWIADTVYAFQGKIAVRPASRSWRAMRNIDAAFNDDGSLRWLSGFMRFAEVPPKQNP